jgi:beta-galactosidase
MWKEMLLVIAVLLAPAAHAGRTAMPLDNDWRFMRGDSASASGAAPGADDSGWQAINLPHTFNAADATDSKYYRGPAWYRRVLTLPEQRAGQRSYLEFDGAMLVSEVWINGTSVGRHEGGFARFRFDVTSHLKPGRNLVAVRVDNARNPDVAPLGGDYTMYGGLYRSVRLVSTDDLHFDMLDHGAPGVYFAASEISPASAKLAWTVRVANDRSLPVHARVTVRLRDALGRIVAQASQRVTAPARAVTPVALQSALAQPRLWQGKRDPYLYSSEAELAVEGAWRQPLDRLAFAVGIRAVHLDADRGLLLNGEPYRVHGVNVHQTTLPGKGTAASEADIDADYRILQDLGVTGLRYSHYQHPQHAYDLSDRLGWLVWTEMPLTAEVNGAPAFQANAAQQLRELIRQNSNHPSVMAWGLGNEIYKVDDASARTLDSLQALAHKEDPSRPTAYANCCSEIDGPQASHTDAVGSNVYYGWYDGEFADLGPFADKNHARRPTTPLAISEYGAGGSAQHQQNPPQRPQPGGRWHPEQYQTLYHEAAWRQLAARPWLWSSFVWVGFDFPSAGRNEGDSPGFNDKGLVSFDRQVKKDAFYWYQANWSSTPMAYITSRRHTQRDSADVEVKVYSNQPSATLRLNGADLGAQPVTAHIATWRLRLAKGANRIEVKAGTAADAVEWQH